MKTTASVFLAVSLLFGGYFSVARADVPLTILAPERKFDAVAYRNFETQKEKVRTDRIKADPRYQQTLLLCQNNWREYGWIAKESAAEMFELGFFYVPAWTRFIENRRIAPDVKDLLDSEAFQKALLDCGDGTNVITKMAVADYAGKAVGIAAVAGTWRFGGPAMARLGTMGRAGSIAQKSLLLVGMGYFVHQSFVLMQAVRNRDTKKESVQLLIEQKSRTMQAGVSQMKMDLENTYRQELIVLESRLLKTDLSSAERREIEARAERIRFVLK